MRENKNKIIKLKNTSNKILKINNNESTIDIASEAYNNYLINRIRIDLGLEKSYKFLQISDYHSDDVSKVRPLLDSVFKEGVNSIFLTGDIWDDSGSIKSSKELIFYLNEKVSRDRIFYVTGNHEIRRDDLGEIISFVRENAIYLDRLSSPITIDDFLIFGIDDVTNNEKDFFYSLEDFKSKLSEASKDKFSILLSHRPEYIKEYSKCGFNFVYSGHAHGGQINLPFIGGLFAPGQGFFPKLDKGLFRYDNTFMFLSAGLTTKHYIIPRFFNRREITLTEFY